MSKSTDCWVWNFRGHQKLVAAASATGSPWVITDTSATGTPTYAGVNAGGVELKHDSANEVQNVCLSFGDVLSWDIDDIIRFWWIAKFVASPNAVTSLAFGMTGARNDAIDTIAQAIIFRCIGDNSVVVESDDGTTDLDDKATGLTLKGTFKRFEVSLTERVTTIEPPSTSKGGKSNIGFYGSNDEGSLRRVASGIRFDMSAYADGLQPFVQLQKTAAASTDSVTLLQFGIEFKLPQ